MTFVVQAGLVSKLAVVPNPVVWAVHRAVANLAAWVVHRVVVPNLVKVGHLIVLPTPRFAQYLRLVVCRNWDKTWWGG